MTGRKMSNFCMTLVSAWVWMWSCVRMFSFCTLAINIDILYFITDKEYTKTSLQERLWNILALWWRSGRNSPVLFGQTLYELPAATQKFLPGSGGHLGHPKSKPCLLLNHLWMLNTGGLWQNTMSQEQTFWLTRWFISSSNFKAFRFMCIKSKHFILKGCSYR